MGIFSLNWFKSEKQKEIESLKVIEQQLYNELIQAQINTEVNKTTYKDTTEPLIYMKPYRKIKLINDVLTIVLNDGSVLSKPNATQEDFNRARTAQTESDLFELITSRETIEEQRKKEAEVAEIKMTIKGVEVLKALDDFIVENDAIYLKETTRSIPELLVKQFAKIVNGNVGQGKIEENIDYQSLKKFWLKCCANPNAQSAEDLYTFLSHHQFKIDRHGNFYAYRNVVSKEDENKELVEFVSNTYNKVKAIWKKKPANFAVWTRLGDYKLIEVGRPSPTDENPYWKLIGNLESLYLDLPDMQKEMYTSAHTGKEDYRVGTVISMPRNEGDDNNNVSCSRGFHAASKAYDYSSFGDTSILVIINPIDVLSVPKNEVGKLRTCRWFFATTLSKEEKHILDDDDFDVSELGDIFEEKCSEDLQGYIQNSFVEEVKRHTFSLPQISALEISNIVISLEDMKKSISERVNTID